MSLTMQNTPRADQLLPRLNTGMIFSAKSTRAGRMMLVSPSTT